MADCDCLPGCPFFHDRMKDMPSLSRLWKKEYCQGDFVRCARHMVKEALGSQAVPDNLFPNMIEKAREIIAS